jgi:type IV secretory pathway TraG/TraD family ATPase VirD4
MKSVLFIRIPSTNERREEAMEHFLHALHNVLPNNAPVSLEIASIEQFLRFYITTEANYKSLTEAQLYAQYPEAEIEEVDDFMPQSFENAAVSQLDFKYSSINSLNTYKDMTESFLKIFSAVLSKTERQEKVILQISLKRVGSKLLERGVGGAYTKLFTTHASNGKFSEELYRGKLRMAYFAEDTVIANQKLSLLINLLKNVKSTNNELKKRTYFVSKNLIHYFKTRTFTGGDYWSVAELATLYHFPTIGTVISNVVQTTSKRAPAPDILPREGRLAGKLSLIGETNYRNDTYRFGILDEDRRRHIYVIGKTGVGKSRFLELLMTADIQHSKGLCLLDPHGDLAEAILRRIPKERIKDVVYVDPSNRDFPIAFNPLEYTKDYERRQHIAFFFISIFKKIFAADWNEQMEHILRYIILALLETPDSNILGIPRILSDTTYRHRVINQLQDPVVKQFWANEFASWNEQYSSQAIIPILNKVGQFISNPIIRNMVGQQKSTLDFEKFMNEGKIVILNVSKGKLGEDNAALLGSMFITKIHQAALARASVREEDRRDFYFYIDEFQNFATEAFQSILSESRKYRLNLTIAHQYINQLNNDIRASVFGNVASLFVFAVGGDDAAYLAKEFSPTFTAEDILSLQTRDMYVKMSINGRTSKPFSARTITTETSKINFIPDIISHTQTQYATNRIAVERGIEKWGKAKEPFYETKKDTLEEFPEPLL